MRQIRGLGHVRYPERRKLLVSIEIVELECALDHVMRSHTGDSKWQHHVGERREA